MAEVAVIKADVGLDTDDVVTVNVPVVCPNGIVIPTGTDAAELLLDKLIGSAQESDEA